jgi:hypothetical protein
VTRPLPTLGPLGRDSAALAFTVEARLGVRHSPIPATEYSVFKGAPDCSGFSAATSARAIADPLIDCLN